ncbi:MAG: EamA family transporter [Nitrospiraceae bacterium]
MWFVAATGCWAVDNNCTQRLSALRDPLQVMAIKAVGGGTTLAMVAVGAGAPWPPFQVVLVGLGVGAVSYGLSLWLDEQALRRVGVARQAAYFATAPFLGAAAAVPLLGERWGLREWGVAALMAAGIALLHRVRYAHRHTHSPLEHAHAHSHDDEHHRHTHAEGEVLADTWHAHSHRHVELTHTHEHLSDLHHRHRHA